MEQEKLFIGTARKSIKNRDDVLFVKEIFNEAQEGL